MMAGRYQPYPEYRDSGVEWLGEVPGHWGVRKLKFMANIQPSNVDKKVKEGEVAVRLCNYTDVYYNDEVDDSIDFMKATATEEQIEKFTLKAGDTIITKDSEDPADIAIPTFVPKDIEGVLCGYHLSIIRPNNIAFGAYIKRLFEAGYVRSYFATRANGLTRYGLGTYALKNVCFPEPLINEAEQIANFLDHETARIDGLIAKQQELVGLLKEKRQAVISHAVTKGLNPAAPLRDSGVEWLGQVPEHWTTKSYRYAALVYRGKFGHRPRNDPAFYDGDYPFIQTGDIARAGKEITEYNQTLNERGKAVSQKFPSGTLVMAIAANIGDTAILGFEAYAPDSVVGFKPSDSVDLEFLRYSLMAALPALEKTSTQSTQANLNIDRIGAVKATFPLFDEQREIVVHLDKLLNRYDAIEAKALAGIELLQERRTALISAAVTGKIDVRNWQPPAINTNQEVAA